jgi:hypothetical protein
MQRKAIAVQYVRTKPSAANYADCTKRFLKIALIRETCPELVEGSAAKEVATEGSPTPLICDVSLNAGIG